MMIEKTDHHASFRGRRLAHFPSPSIHASGEKEGEGGFRVGGGRGGICCEKVYSRLCILQPPTPPP